MPATSSSPQGTTSQQNVWAQMNYVPPRGPCNYKQGVLSPRCACLRFMLHPLKSASSFECDGCGHHASFHDLDNQAEDEIRARWEREGKGKERPRKRPRAIEARKEGAEVVEVD